MLFLTGKNSLQHRIYKIKKNVQKIHDTINSLQKRFCVFCTFKTFFFYIFRIDYL